MAQTAPYWRCRITIFSREGRHSIEVAFALFTQQPRVWFSALTRIFLMNFSEEIRSWCCRDLLTALLRVWKAWICWSNYLVLVSGKQVLKNSPDALIDKGQLFALWILYLRDKKNEERRIYVDQWSLVWLSAGTKNKSGEYPCPEWQLCSA